MAFMKMFHGKRLTIGGAFGKKVVVHRDGTINRIDLEKLTIDELFEIYKNRCNGKKREGLIGLIMEGIGPK